jgi:hypothetical protein
MNTETPVFQTRHVWLVALIAAMVLGVPLSFLASKAPWVVCIPILAGTGIVLLLEAWRLTTKRRIQPALLKMPRDFLGMAGYKGYAVLAVPVEEEEKESQEIFDFLRVSRRKAPKTARIIKDESGREVYLIDCERFVTMLLNRMLPNTDKATEMSLIHALHRYGEMRSTSVELEYFLRDKTVLDVIKSDFRGNTALTINRSGEAVIRELIKEAKAAKESKQGQLEVQRS